MTTDLTEPQKWVLMYLHRAGWASARAVASVRWNDRNQASRAQAIIDRLAAKGLAERKFSTYSAWTLTRAGTTLARPLCETSA
jgi:DNA-binding MarR family transcriptional regulator